MGPLNQPLMATERTDYGSADTGSTRPALSLLETIGIGVAVSVALSLAVFAIVWYWCNQRSRMSRASRPTAWQTGKAGKSRVGAPALKSRCIRILSVLSTRRRALTKVAAARKSQMPCDELNELHGPALEAGGKGSSSKRGSGIIFTYHVSDGKAEQEFDQQRKYQAQGMPSNATTLSVDDRMPKVPLPTTARPSELRSKRSTPPPPLNTALPLSLPRDLSEPCSTYVNPYSPYEYCFINMPSPLRSPSSHGNFALYSTTGSHSLRSSVSNLSTQPLRCPVSPQSPDSASSMSRSNSFAHTESHSLPPPTPTYSQQPHSQRSPIDSENIVCLGPLPANIPLPSPRDFSREHHFHRKIPETLVADNKFSDYATTSSSIRSVGQDHLLHDQSPLRPHLEPTVPMIQEHSERNNKYIEEKPWEHILAECERRQSTDSLGSNYTVEEEARIQAQIARNLGMLGQERVFGQTDLVHIPQISEKRYSWEEAG